MLRKVSVVKIAVLFLLVLLATEASAISTKQYAVIINLAGRQRMLTQKMSKEMLLVAKGIDVEKNKASLKKTAALFDKTLRGLIRGNKKLGLPPTKGKSTLRTMKKVEKLWGGFKKIVDGVVAGGEVPVAKVASLNLPLLKTMNAAVRLYEKEAKKAVGMSAGVVINLAGKQRMLTQKMSKEMLLVALGHDTDRNKAELKSTASLFDRTLRGLKDGDTDLGLPGTGDSAILAQLDTVSGLWGDLKPLVDQVTDIDATGVPADVLRKMANLNLPLLKEMNKAVKMYADAQ